MRRLTALASAFLLAIAGSTASMSAQRGAESGRGSPPSNGITGRVLDPSGKAVKSTITALRPAPERPYGFEPVSVQLRTETDEQGTFVLDGLALGEYYVIAVPNSGLTRPVVRLLDMRLRSIRVRCAWRMPAECASPTRATANIPLLPTELRP